MPRYPVPVITLHWLTALALVVAYASSGDPTKAGHALSGALHVASGLAVWVLVALRLPLRFLLGAPAPAPGPRWQQRAAQSAHVALYALMLAVPLAGWAALAHETSSYTVAGFTLPLPGGAHAPWVRALAEAHPSLGDVFVWIAGLHAAAALAHRYWLRDGTLERMLPRRR